jgi:hypothetical protein
MKQIITEVATVRQVPLIDFAAYIEGKSEHGITGADWFLDHVHLTKEGYREIALRLLDSMTAQKIVAISRVEQASSEILRECQGSQIQGFLSRIIHGITAPEKRIICQEWQS